MADLTENEKSFWRIVAALQELLRVSDEDIESNPHLKKLLYQVANVAIMYREHGPEKVLQDSRAKELEKMGIPTIKPKPRKR